MLWKDDFEPGEYRDRQARVRAKMAEQGLDLLIVIHPVNINWLAAARPKSYQEFQCLLLTRDEGPMTILTRLAEVWECQAESLAEDVRGWGGRDPEDPIEVLGAILREKGWAGARIGFEVPRYYLGAHEYVALKALLGPGAVEASRLVESLKFAKSPAEIAYIRKASSLADAGIHAFSEKCHAGMTEHQMAAEIYYAMMSRNGELAASPINICSGPRGSYGHGLPSERVVEAGDFMQLEYGASYRRYHTSIGRHAVAGKPTARMKELSDIIIEACDACMAEIKPGVRAVVPHEAARKVIADAGLLEYMWHLSGYGIGSGYPPLWAENFSMFGGSEDVIEENMVLTIEPPAFIPPEGVGFRLIDNVLVTRTGVEMLSKTGRDIIEI